MTDTEYRWSAGRVANYWPGAAGRYGTLIARDWVDEWLTDHHTAADDLRYPIRRTPAPAEPLTERVPLAECLGREVLVGERACPIFAVDLSLGSYKADGGWVHHEMRCDADGTVEVLRRSTEDGKR